MKKKIDKKKYLNVIISKSGNTTETIVNSNLFILSLFIAFESKIGALENYAHHTYGYEQAKYEPTQFSSVFFSTAH